MGNGLRQNEENGAKSSDFFNGTVGFLLLKVSSHLLIVGIFLCLLGLSVMLISVI